MGVDERERGEEEGWSVVGSPAVCGFARIRLVSLRKHRLAVKSYVKIMTVDWYLLTLYVFCIDFFIAL